MTVAYSTYALWFLTEEGSSTCAWVLEVYCTCSWRLDVCGKGCGGRWLKTPDRILKDSTKFDKSRAIYTRVGCGGIVISLHTSNIWIHSCIIQCKTSFHFNFFKIHGAWDACVRAKHLISHVLLTSYKCRHNAVSFLVFWALLQCGID